MDNVNFGENYDQDWGSNPFDHEDENGSEKEISFVLGIDEDETDAYNLNVMEDVDANSEISYKRSCVPKQKAVAKPKALSKKSGGTKKATAEIAIPDGTL